MFLSLSTEIIMTKYFTPVECSACSDTKNWIGLIAVLTNSQEILFIPKVHMNMLNVFSWNEAKLILFHLRFFHFSDKSSMGYL